MKSKKEDSGVLKNIALMFPGQGSQYTGMGSEFLGTGYNCRRYFDISSEIAGKDLLKIIQGRDEDNSLDDTRFSQISIYSLSCALNDYILNNLSIKREYIHTVLGHSLGEYSALYSSGAYDFKQGAALVGYRGMIMSEANRDEKGMMAAVLGSEPNVIKDVLKNFAGRVFIANYNDCSQIVISGYEGSVKKAMEELKSRGAKKIIPLKVGIASHSPLMKRVSDELGRYIEQNIDFIDMKFPFFSTTEITYRTRDDIGRTLTGQLVGPIRWIDSIEYLLENGTDIFIEVGPGSVLSGLVGRIAKRNGRTVTILKTDRMEDIENLKIVLEKDGIINEA
ncbi:MAG: ACP S-malonyltransferase [Actinomycetota bacterium]|nr:ACP S-malonyltransferase [Actinomycetota bacterium]